jgi:hypothetical protein
MSGKRGILTLTNARLNFEGERDQGLIASAVRGPQYATLVDIRLSDLANVHVDKALLGRSKLRVEAYGRSVVFLVGSADAWAGAIRQAHGYAVQAYAAQRMPAPVVVNVSQAAPPPPQTYFHCRHCGSIVPTNAVAGAMRCTACGAAL